jgi:ubiquitin-like protein Pup
MTTHETSGQQRSRRAQDEVDETGPAANESLKERQDKLDGDVDSILDEIDEVLEENAEEWVRGFVQKGGQ